MKIQRAHIWRNRLEREREPRIKLQEPKRLRKRGGREKGIALIVIAVALFDCKHHHHHRRSVYKKNFFLPLLLWGNANLSLSPSISLAAANNHHSLMNYQKGQSSEWFILVNKEILLERVCFILGFLC